jgi:hypothetical protein
MWDMRVEIMMPDLNAITSSDILAPRRVSQDQQAAQ